MRKLKLVLAMAAFFFGAASARAQGGFPQTPHFSFCLPPNGVTAWGVCYNGSMTKIDNTLWALQNPYQGAWSSGINYQLDNIVTYSGGTYLSTIANNTGITPGSSSSWLALGSAGSGSGCTGPTVTLSLSGQVATITDGCISAIGSPFAVSMSCTAAGGPFEAGNNSTNPNTCTLSYSNGTPASGTVSDGTHNVTLTTPFTSAVFPYVYSANTTWSATTTSTAPAQTAGATQGRSFAVREFAGVGTAGATGLTASGTSAVLVGATGTLPSAGLGAQTSWGPLNPSDQYIYVVALSNSCSFSSGGFGFPMHAPVSVTMTNAYGSNVTVWMYMSINSLSVPFTLGASSC